MYDIEKEFWHKVACTGEIPPPRYGHSAHVFVSRMFIFGGRGAKGALYKDVYFLDLVEWKWSSVNALSKGPSGRLFHAAEQVGRKIVIHGGWDGTVAFDDMYIFNTDSFSWSTPKTSGFSPSARYGQVRITLIHSSLRLHY